MKGPWWAGLSPMAGRRRLAALAGKLLHHSFVFYLVAVAANKTWLLLNSDITHLIRRAH